VIRTFHWRCFRLVAAARLRRLGGRLVVEAGGTPRLRGPLRLETGPRPGTLTLRVGRDVTMGRECVLDLTDGTDGLVELGDGAVLQSRVRLQPWGGAIRIASGAQVRDGCELKSKGELRVGERAICGRNATVHCHTAVTLGADVGLAERVTITDSDHATDGSDTWFMDQPVHADEVVLGRNVFCATNAVVLRGTRIGANSVVAAGAVVTGGEHPSGWLIGGVPAKALKPLAGARHDDPSLPLR
jgi:acetyltransferase-like isoleucine patch superfamily enzyme